MKKLKAGKMKKPKMAQPAMAMDSYKPMPVSIHLHAEGEHLDAAHKALAKQLKPMGFVMKKKKMPGMQKKSISEALSS